MTSHVWWRLAVLGVLVGVVALGGCKSGGGGGTGDDAEPIATDTDPSGDGVWSPEEAADAIAEAATEAASGFEPEEGLVRTRLAVVDAAVEAAVDQAMFVSPDLGIDTKWAEAIRTEINAGVVTGEGGATGGGVVVLEEFIKTRVRAKTLEWMRSPR